jgi:hypothetical protein
MRSAGWVAPTPEHFFTEEKTMRIPTFTARRALRVGLAALVVAGGIVGFTASSSSAATAATLLPATGPGGTTAGQTVITLTGTGFRDALGASALNTTSATGTVAAGTTTTAAGNAAVQFQTGATCATTFSASSNINVALAAVSNVSATKLVITVPQNNSGTAFLALTASTSAPKAYMLCVYNNASTPALIDSAKYTVYAIPTVTGISPASGRSFGGTTVTLAGTGFTTKSAVTIGGSALTGIKVATDGLSLTGTIPAHAAGAGQAVHVTTEGGPDTNSVTFTYVSAISVSPSTGLNATATTIDVTGTGFTTVFAAANTNAAVVFTAGAYTAAVGGANVGVCTNVRIISDSELVCDTPSNLSNKALSVVVVTDNTSATLTTSLPTSITSGATFTFGAF